MDAKLRDQVRTRAANRCEYCRLRQEHAPYHSFHVEHIIAKQHGGNDDLENLAWACHQCNLHKGTNLSSVDPDTNEVTRLFHPRKTTGMNISRWTTSESSDVLLWAAPQPGFCK